MAKHSREMTVVALLLMGPLVSAFVLAQNSAPSAKQVSGTSNEKPEAAVQPGPMRGAAASSEEARRAFDTELESISKVEQEGRLLDAEKLLKSAIDKAHATPSTSWEMSALLRRLARVEYEMGHYSQAEAACKRTVTADKGLSGRLFPRVLFDLDLLAYYSDRAGDRAAGESALEQGVAIARKHPGPRERNLLIALRNIESFDEQGGHEAKARLARAKSVGICKAQSAPHSPMCRLILEDFYRANGDTKDAQKIRSEETARGRRYYHGREDYGREINMLGARAAQYEREGSYDLAEATYRKEIALAGKEAKNPNPLITANVYISLGQLLDLEGKKSKAEAAYMHSFDILERVQGRFRIAAVERLSGTPLVTIYQRDGRMADAEAILQRVLADQEKALGPHDVHLALTLLELVGMKDLDGKYSEAQGLCARALEIQQADYGADNPALIPVLSAEAGILRQLGETAKAAAVTARIKTLETRAAALHERTYADTRAFGLPLVMPMLVVAGRAQPPAPKGPLPGHVVTVSPACVESTREGPPIAPQISIWYNPRAPGATLKSPQSLTLVFATPWGLQYKSQSMAMTRAADGTWRAEYTPAHDILPYGIFFFEDGKKRVDNNKRQYWDILNCYGGEPGIFSLIEQAQTYTGRLLAPGIERPPDLPRAIEILKDGLKREPQAYELYFSLWQDELKLGDESPAAYQQVGKEIDAFLKANSSNGWALQQVSGFVAVQQQKLPPEVVQKFRVVASTLGVSQILADFDYWAVVLEKTGLQKKAQDYLAFAAEDPKGSEAGQAYGDAFDCERQLNNVAGAEAIYKKWEAADSASPYPALAMARLYVEKKIRPNRVVKLLDKANAAYARQRRPGWPRYPGPHGLFQSLRGQAELMLNNLPASRADLEAAAKAMPENPDLYYALGQACERMGDPAAALKAYLAAAISPYEENSAPSEAYERLFVAQKLGSAKDADRRIAAQIAENNRRAAAAYTPMPLSRPAPKFSFTDLAGKRFDNQTTEDKPTLIVFWSPG